MKIGVYYPDFIPHSAGYYVEHIRKELSSAGVEFVKYSSRDELPPDVNLYWDFHSMGGNPPHHHLKKASKPVVVTVHGAAPFAMPGKDLYPSLRSRMKSKVTNYRKLRGWRGFNDVIVAIITVSQFAKDEIQRCLKLDKYPIFPIYHGVNHQVFRPLKSGEPGAGEKPYLLHVSHYHPIKNVERIIYAYQGIQTDDKPDLVLILPGYKGKRADPGVRLITEPQHPAELAEYYRGARGFVFPSLRESFGMPVLEAMASGCPVITSNVSGCNEIAASAALLVNPYSVQEIREAMAKLLENSNLRSNLREKGLERASKFSWQTCAKRHFEVLSQVIGDDA